jgi:hypothetical protein
VPEVPAALRPLWDVYLQLDAGRAGGGFAAASIGWQDIYAWQQTTGRQLTGWEAETLIRIDRAIRAIFDKD